MSTPVAASQRSPSSAWVPAVLDALGKLQAGRLACAHKAPYWRAGLMRLVFTKTPGLGTVGVSERGRLYWDPEAVDRWEKQANGAAKIAGAMAHELLHVLFNHAGRGRAIGALSEEQRKLWNESGDLAINVILRAGGWVLPDGALYPELFKYPADLTAEGYYALRLEDAKKAPKKQGGKGAQKAQQGTPAPGQGNAPQQGAGTPGAPSQGQGEGAAGEGPAVGAGWCGSCAGRPLPQEPAEGSAPQAGDATDTELERIRRSVASEIRAAKAAGKLPAELERWADEMLTPPKVRWSTKLERACRNGIAVRSGVTDYTRSKPSRRQWGVGVGIGRPVLAAMYSRKPRVAFAIDTSGSMGDAEIRTAATEVRGVLNALGYAVDFLSCDTEIGRVGTVKRVEDMRGMIVGGGGTDFRPVFDHLEGQGFEGVLIYATDGYGPAPEVAPKGITTIWLLVGESTQEPAEWGECIRVDND